MNEQNKTQQPISNMDERKFKKMLNQRGVNTLMIPLNKGKKENETTPW
jgi:Ca-activated chloride channel family protein